MYNVIHLGFFSWFSVVIPFDFTDLMGFFSQDFGLLKCMNVG